MNMCEWERLRFLSSDTQSCLSVVCISALVQPPPSSLGLSMAYVDPVTSRTLSLPWLLRAWGRAAFPILLCGLRFVQRRLDPEMSPWLHGVVFIVLSVEKRNSAQVRIMCGVYICHVHWLPNRDVMKTLFRMNRWFILKSIWIHIRIRGALFTGVSFGKISRRFHRAPD